MRGIYLLLIEVEKEIIARIGALGKIKFVPGFYVYIGSAQNNLEKRISRHLSKNKKKFWHIDYLLDNNCVHVKEVYVKENAKKEEECEIAEKFKSMANPLKRFGCSDCSCTSHLFKTNRTELIKLITCLGMKIYLTYR
jgi:Uri superfamily endonuclease